MNSYMAKPETSDHPHLVYHFTVPLSGSGFESGCCPYSTALTCGSFSEKSLKKSTCTVMIRIIIAFRNQIFL